MSKFKNVSMTLSASQVAVYTVPAGKSAIIIGATAAHCGTVEGAVYINACKASNSSGANAINIIGVNTTIPVGSALNFVSGKLVMLAGETLFMSSSAVSSCDVSLSIMETDA